MAEQSLCQPSGCFEAMIPGLRRSGGRRDFYVTGKYFGAQNEDHMYAQRKSLFGSSDKACLGTKRACEEIKEFTEGCGKYT